MIVKRAMPIILIDSMAILHSLKYAEKRSYAFDKGYNAVMDSFFASIAGVARSLYSHRIIFMWDSKEKKRTALYPEYKAGRIPKNQTDEEKEYDIHCIRQFNLLRDKIIPYIGFESYYREGYEADDLIASAVMNNPEHQFIFVSTDADLYQLLPYARMFNYRTKNIINRETFEFTYGIKAEDWWKVKMYAGCNSDNIKGLYRIGEASAIAYLRNEITPKSKKYKTFQEADKELLELNKRLVKLPFEDCEPVKINGNLVPSFNKFKEITSYHNLLACNRQANMENIRTTLKMGL